MELNTIRYMGAETAVQYLKKMVFPYLTHEEKMLTGQFFYEAELMEKEQIMAFAKLWEEKLLDGRIDSVDDLYNKTYKQ
jgi:hypothetical protein